MEIGNATGEFGALSLPLSKVYRSKYKDCGIFTCKTEWRSINAEVVTWNEGLYGDRMKYVWIEEALGDPIEEE